GSHAKLLHASDARARLSWRQPRAGPMGSSLAPCSPRLRRFCRVDIRPPHFTLPLLTTETRAHPRAAALPFASLFIVALPFDHTAALRLVLLTIAVGCTFFGGGWRVVHKVPLLLTWSLWALAAGVSVLGANDVRDSFGEFRNEIVYPFCAYAT